MLLCTTQSFGPMQGTSMCCRYSSAVSLAGLAKRLQPVSSAQTRAGAALNHGSHMAMSMALGLLFMGGGATTFSTNDEAVAALVIALYPKFPRSTTDNRHHHQVGDPCQAFIHQNCRHAAQVVSKCSQARMEELILLCRPE